MPKAAPRTDSSVIITKVAYKNIGMYDSEVLNLSKVTVISAKNGLGKTTLMDGILSVLGEPDADLITDEADTGTIAIDLSNGMRVDRILSHVGKTGLEVTNRDGSSRDRPKQFMKSISDARAVNPITFLTAKPKEQIDWLLKSCDLHLEESARAKLLVMNDDQPLLESDPIAYIDATREIVYNRRTSAGGAVTTLKGHVVELRETLPTDYQPVVDKVDITAMQDERDKLLSEYNLRLREFTADIESKKQALAKRADTDIAEVDKAIAERNENAKKNIQRQIDTLKAELQATLEEAAVESKFFAAQRTLDLDTDLESVANALEEWKITFAEQCMPLIGKMRTDIALAQQSAEERARQEATYLNVNKAQRELAEREAIWQALEDQVKWIDLEKIELMKGLPFGLSIKDGLVYLGKIPWKRVNTGQAVSIAVKLAEKRTGLIKTILMDQGERLDKENFDALIEHCRRGECQFIVFKVSNGEMEIEYFDALETEATA